MKSNYVYNLKTHIEKSSSNWLARNRSLVLRQTPVWAQALSLVMLSIGTVAIAGGLIFRIDEVISVPGQLQSIKGSIDVKTPAGGKILRVLVKDGQSVSKGDLLMEFDTRQAQREKLALTSLIKIEKKELNSRINLLKDRQDVLSKKYDTQQKIVESLRSLVEDGGFQKMQFYQQLDSLFELETQLNGIENEKAALVLTSERSLSQLTTSLNQAELQIQYQKVVAPESGIVFNTKAQADGVLGGGETILTIVPQEGLQAKIYVTNKDIGFVTLDQKANIRVDAFPFTRYGELKGEITNVGADALEPDLKQDYFRYPVTVKLDKSYLELKETKIPLRSGMAITANIKLRDKRLISIVSDMFINQTETIKTLRQQ